MSSDHGERSTANGERRTENEHRLFTFVAPFLLLALVAVLHYDALGEWWKTDDPQIVLHAIRNSPAETLFSPVDWQTLSVGFTPLVTLSFDLDFTMAGIRPFFFYAHQLLAIAVATLLLFILLEPICGRWLALLTAAAAAAGPAMTLAAESLMIRHYVEGLALALAALIVWRLRPSSSFSPGRDVSAAIFYLLATLAKEIYAPLPLLFVADALIRRVPLRRIALRLLPSAAAALVYLAWRRWMLGSFGGYGEPVSPARLPGAAWHSVQALFPSDPPLVFLATLLLTLAALAVLVARKPRAGALLIAALGIAVLLPFVGVGGLAEARYGFAPVIVAVALTGIGLARLPARVGLTGGAVLLLLHAWGGIALDRNSDRTDAFGRAEGLYVWQASPAAPPLLAGSPGWYLAGLRDLRRFSGGGASPRFVLSLEGVDAGAAEPEDVVRMEGEPPAARHLDPDTLLRVMEARSRFDPAAPIALRVGLRELAVSWDLAPAVGSRFTWLTLPEYDDYGIPPVGSLRIPAPTPGQQFRIRRDLPDGTWTLSPVFDLPAEGETIEWRRSDPGA